MHIFYDMYTYNHHIDCLPPQGLLRNIHDEFQPRWYIETRLQDLGGVIKSQCQRGLRSLPDVISWVVKSPRRLSVVDWMLPEDVRWPGILGFGDRRDFTCKIEDFLHSGLVDPDRDAILDRAASNQRRYNECDQICVVLTQVGRSW